jgi:hypothetical protein
VTRTGGQGAKRTARTSGRRAAAASGQEIRTRRGRAARLLLAAKITGVVSLVVLVGFGLLYVRLLQGPLSLQFLAQPIERAIAEEFAGVNVGIESVAIRLADGGHLEFELTNLRVADAAKTPLAFAPSASISLSRKALMSGRLAPESVDLNAPRLSLFHGDDGVISLKFSHPAAAPEAERATRSALRGSTDLLPTRADDADGALARIDLIKALSEASAVARRRENAGAYLRSVGLRSATVVIDNGARKSIWRLPELDIDLDHKRSRSSIAGRAKVESLTGPWTVNFRTYEVVNNKTLQLAVSVQNLVPRGLSRALPQLAGLESFDVPVWGEARLDLSNTGEILSGSIGIDAAPGQVLLPWLAATPFRIDGGHIALSYSREARRFEVEPSVLVWGDSRLQFTGAVTHTQQAPGGPGWAFDFKSAGGWLGAEPPHLQRLTIDDWSAKGLFSPEQGRVTLDQFSLRAGGADVMAQGEVTDMAGAMKARLDGKIGAMPASVFKTLWPGALAPRTRDWVVAHLARGWLQGGSFRLSSASEANGVWTATTSADRGSLTLEGAHLAFALVEGWPLLEAPRALVRLDSQNFELTVPDASFALADGRRLSLKGSFAVDMTAPPDDRTGTVNAKIQGPLAVPLDMLNREPLNALQGTGLTLAGIDGKVDGQLAIALPLGKPVTTGDVKVQGKVRVTEGRLKHAFGAYDVTAANIAVEMTDAAVEANGEMLINGVHAKGSLQQVFGAAPEKQPPINLSMTLDEADRTQLGLDINDLVQGEVGLDVTAALDAKGERRVHVRANLANAEVTLDSVAWRKPKGRPGIFEFDVAKGAGQYPMELHGVKMHGENVAIEGWMGVGADHKVKEFKFPNFSLNVVSRLQTDGKMRPDGIWDVTAKGPTFDGRDIFKAFFDVARQPNPNAKIRPGLDLSAEVTTVVGYSDSALRHVKITLQKRAEKLVALDVRGTLDGGKEGGRPFSAVLQPTPGQPRRLLADASDAGQLFRLVGFYPNARGGLMNLEVNLDGQGAAERTGTLWARKFVVLGDPIVNEMVLNAEGVQPKKKGSDARQQFEFNIMKVVFSTGHGQFVINDGALNGPFEGATIRGKVDYRSQTIDMGGTYVGGTGLLTAAEQIPIFGPLFMGPRGEGIFGITYGIKGSLAKPQVIVNPLSLITPGIFREIWQMTPDDPTVQPREKPRPKAMGPRSSSAPAATASDETTSWPEDTTNKRK